MRKSIILRRISQGFFLILFLYMLLPASHRLRNILPVGAFFKMDPLTMASASISGRTIVPGIIFAVFMLILTLILGRFFCGWVCPLGTTIDLCGNIRDRNLDLGKKGNKRIRLIKYYILGLITVFSFLSIEFASLFDPLVITARFFSLNLVPILKLNWEIHLFSYSAFILIFFLFICATTLITRRFWCRSVCPLGAIYAIVARFSLLSREVEECIKCSKCKNNCRMQAIKDDLSYVKGECILCMDCIYDCPIHKTKFVWRFLKKIKIEEQKKTDFTF